MDLPLVSVILPTYNRPALLKESLESVLGQTYKNLEILVIDDGSKGSENEELCSDDPRIRYRKIENSGGPARPRNIGMSLAQGNYLAFIDDDDRWLPEKIRMQVEFVQKHPEVGLVHSPCMEIDQYGEQTGKVVGRPGSLGVKSGNVIPRMIGNWTLMTSTVIMKKELYDQLGGFNENMPAAGEDYEYWARCAVHTELGYLDDPLSAYRIQPGISTANSKDYVQTPRFLWDAMRQQAQAGYINVKDLNKIQKQLVRMQIKRVHLNKSEALGNLKQIDQNWWLRAGNWKLLISRLIKH